MGILDKKIAEVNQIRHSQQNEITVATNIKAQIHYQVEDLIRLLRLRESQTVQDVDKKNCGLNMENN